MTLSKLPILFDIVRSYVEARQKAGYRLMFNVLGRQACVFMADCLKEVAT